MTQPEHRDRRVKSNEVTGSQQGPRPRAGGDATGARVREAERLFASLANSGAPRRNGVEPACAERATAEPALAPPAAEPGVVDLVLATIDCIAEVAGSLGTQIAASTAEMRALTQAVEQALTATNDRLVALERSQPTGAAPASAPAEQALRRLLDLRQAVNGSGHSTG